MKYTRNGETTEVGHIGSVEQYLYYRERGVDPVALALVRWSPFREVDGRKVQQFSSWTRHRLTMLMRQIGEGMMADIVQDVLSSWLDDSQQILNPIGLIIHRAGQVVRETAAADPLR